MAYGNSGGQRVNLTNVRQWTYTTDGNGICLIKVPLVLENNLWHCHANAIDHTIFIQRNRAT